MAKWLAKEFDWTLGQYTGNYYDIAEAGVVAVFVCSYTGDDTNPGTAASPFKTLSKAITTLNATGANGSRIFMNGAFSENLPTQTYWYEFIGCGGGKNGRTIWWYNVSENKVCKINKAYSKYHNIETLDYTTTVVCGTMNYHYFVNCYLKNFAWTTGWAYPYYFYYTILQDCWVSTNNALFYGNKNTFFRLSTQDTYWVPVHATNSHCFEFFDRTDGQIEPARIFGVGTLDVEGQYIDPDNGNFALKQTSPLLFGGTIDSMTGIGEHVGAGYQGFEYDPLGYSLTANDGATITNLEISNGRLVRTDPNIAGSLETGSIDLGAPYPITQLTVENIFEYDTTGVSKGVFEDLTGSPRPALTILMKYGNTEAERDACPWLEVEYGKRPTYSGSGEGRVGNGDDTFDSDNELTITARYFKYKFTLQDR